MSKWRTKGNARKGIYNFLIDNVITSMTYREYPLIDAIRSRF